MKLKKIIGISFGLLFTITNVYADTNNINILINSKFLDKKAKNFLRYKVGKGFLEIAIKRLKEVFENRENLIRAIQEGKQIKRPYYYYDFQDYKNLHSPYREIWLYIDKSFYEETKDLLKTNYLKWKNQFENNKYIEKAIYYILYEIQKEQDQKIKKQKQIERIFNIPISFDLFVDYEMKHGNYLLKNINNKLRYDEIKRFYYTMLKQYKAYGIVNPQLVRTINADIENFLIENKLLAEYKIFYNSIIYKLRKNINPLNYVFKY